MRHRRVSWVWLFAALSATAAGCATEGATDPPAGDRNDTDDDGFPSLDDDVVAENEFCVYQDVAPYVKAVKWDHPKVKQALRGLGPGWRSTFSYADWRVPYGLEKDNEGTDVDKRNSRARNFLRVLCGEFRDYPEMIETKLDVVGNRQFYAGPGEVKEFDLSKDLFAQITLPAYNKLVDVMRTMHSVRQQKIADEKDGFNYNFGEEGHDSNRVEHSVPPTTHCEMKYIFSRFMIEGAPSLDEFVDPMAPPDPSVVNTDQYETELAAFRAEQCTPADEDLMYNFRGHNNQQPLWLESNAFIWNSRRARKAEIARGSRDYYLRPFADRFARAKGALAAYLFHTDADNQAMRAASESGGGPIMYVTDQDADDNGLIDYRLFADSPGCGDQGVGAMNPDQNCNMVPWETAAQKPNSTGATEGWDKSMLDLPDLGFLKVFPTFEERMARFNQALDRHTNWGPTSYYMIEASPENAAPNQIAMQPAYSPIVACSYDISASDGFARRSFVSNPFEDGKVKWMFIMRFKASDYYDEEDMKAGAPIDFSRHYFNETSLSNDFFAERALDRFGYAPPDDLHAIVYFVYGDRGEQPPPLEDIPPPAAP
jgi:hypothetical protein